MLGAFFLVPTALYATAVSCRAAKIKNAPDATTAFRRYLGAIVHGHYQRAYSVLVPTARSTGRAAPVRFNKIPADMSEQAIVDKESFAAYWRSLCKGPSGSRRSLTVSKMRLAAASDEFAVIEAELSFNSYPTWLLFTLVLGVLPGLIVLVAAQTQEEKTIRKLIVRRGGRFFVAEGEFVGPLDGIRWASGAPGQ
jgi:hypothetical protein